MADFAALARTYGTPLYVYNFDTITEQFTGLKGQYVPVKETVRGFKEILEGKCDDIPEAAFMWVGTVDESREKAKAMA